MPMTKERLLKLYALVLVGSALTAFPFVWIFRAPDILIIFSVCPAIGIYMQAMSLGLLRGYTPALLLMFFAYLTGLACGWAAPVIAIKLFAASYLAGLITVCLLLVLLGVIYALTAGWLHHVAGELPE